MIHEIAHGAMALKLGDDTAQKLGRLTLNPLKHIDLFGSIILPAILIIPGLLNPALRSPFLIGWAKPVPYDPRRLRDPRTGAALIALAGPATNIVLAIIFGIFSWLIPLDHATKTQIINEFIQQGNVAFSNYLLINIFISTLIIIYINLLLAIFNLIPIPPLDGSKLLFYFLPQNYRLQAILETYGPILLLIFIFGGFFSFVAPIIQFIFQLIVSSSVL